MLETRIGTSGFSYRDWQNTVYPTDLDSRSRLHWYAQRLSMVELNFSFYRMPLAAQLERMAAEVPKDFSFVVKAHRSLTHETTSNVKDDCARFADALRPLIERTQLSGTLVQLPYRFHYTRENRCYLASLLTYLEKVAPAVEFRNDEWQIEPVYRELVQRNVPLVWTDMPRLKGLPRLEPVATAQTGYLRLHGRNDATWWHGTNETRYHYKYGINELCGIIDTITPQLPKLNTLIVAFNNHFGGNSFTNAKELSGIITRAG